MPDRLKIRLTVGILLCIFAGQSFNNARSHSSTWDETHYFGIGKYLLTNFKWDVPGAILQPPLSFYITSIPLLFVDTDDSLWVDKKISGLGGWNIVRGQLLLSSAANREDVQLIFSRLMVTLVGVLLGFYLYRFSSALYGEAGGILSLFLFTFCPNMLAFSAIAVPDMPFTAFSFISVYYLWLSLKSGARDKFLLSGLFLGLALLTKVPALLFIPVHLFLYTAYMFQQKRFQFRNFLLLLCCAFLVLCAGYGFDLSPYFQGIAYQWNQARLGNDAFLAGAYSAHGWWYFYLAALALKTPIPVLLLLGVALTLLFRNKGINRMDILFTVLPIAVLIGYFSLAQYTIALRYVLPIFPFMLLVIGSLANFGKHMRYLIYICAVWSVGGSLYVAPHYLAYFNEFAGGPGNGYRYLVDANLDWGQDLKGLKKFMLEKGIERISLSYSGTDAPQRYGIAYDWLPSLALVNPEPDRPVQIMRNRFLAISVTNLQGLNFSNREYFKWLLQYEPVAKIGYSIFVYDLEKVKSI